VDEETSTIKQRIDNEREQLGRNLDEIEYRVRKATDLKTHFDRNTAWILGGAVVGGFMLSRVFRKSDGSGNGVESEPDAPERNAPAASPSHLSRLSETFDDILQGLVGVVSHKLHSFVADAVPGFGEQYAAIERERGRQSAD